jgi:hypothetical protein
MTCVIKTRWDIVANKGGLIFSLIYKRNRMHRPKIYSIYKYIYIYIYICVCVCVWVCVCVCVCVWVWFGVWLCVCVCASADTWMCARFRLLNNSSHFHEVWHDTCINGGGDGLHISRSYSLGPCSFCAFQILRKRITYETNKHLTKLIR